MRGVSVFTTGWPCSPSRGETKTPDFDFCTRLCHYSPEALASGYLSRRVMDCGEGDSQRKSSHSIVSLRQAKSTGKTDEPVKTRRPFRWQHAGHTVQQHQGRSVSARSGYWPLTRRRLPFSQVLWREQIFHLSSLAVILLLFTLITVSGPHLVHHALDRSPPKTQHPHDEDTPHSHSHDAPVRKSSGCLVLFLMQHNPVTPGGLASFLPVLACGEPIVAAATLQPPVTPQPGFQARAPPV
jgi:hypothetical protein